MIHTEFSDNPDQFPYNINDEADIDIILNVWHSPLLVLIFIFFLAEIFIPTINKYSWPTATKPSLFSSSVHLSCILREETRSG